MERLGLDSGDSTDHYRDAFNRDDDGELQLPRGVEHVILAMVKQDFPQLTKQYKIDCRCLYDGDAEGNEKHRTEVRVDASIVFPEKKLHVFLEVDENQHRNSQKTTPLLELRRMQDATDALRETTQADDERVLWVRFNPSGSFRTAGGGGGASASPPLAQRVAKLREFLLEYEPPRDGDDGDAQVAYMFYDAVDEGGDDDDWVRVVDLPSS